MKITCNHPKSTKGVPVILDDDGNIMDYVQGLTDTLKALDMTREEAAQAAGYKSKRSIDKFWQAHTPSARLLNVLGMALENANNSSQS
jgi:ABC-type Fe2+-enterobactin transport system substrate-binding protein